MRQANEREDQVEGVQNSGKSSTGVRGPTIVSLPRLARWDTIDPAQLAKQHTLCALIWTAAGMQVGRGREGARKDGEWEGGSKRIMGEGERDRGEGASDDARQGESVSGGKGVG